MSQTIPAEAINWETLEGSSWALQDAEVARAYGGKWVVAVPGKVIAFGDELNQVAAEAAMILGVDSNTIVVQSIGRPDEWLQDYPVQAGFPIAQSAG